MVFASSPEPPQRLVRARGADDPWLAALPALARRMLDRWELTGERLVVPGGRAALVVLARRADGTPVALKLCADGPAAEAEAAALERWAGLGAVRLLASAPEEGALLLERLHGEVSLRSLPEPKATLEAVSAVRRLWVDPGGGAFATVAEHTAAEAASMLAQAPPAVRAVVDETLAVRDELLADPPSAVLLHGDFRQGAVLSSGADAASGADRPPWLAVGPEPLAGEPAFDLARLARDRLHDLVASAGAPAAARRRVVKLADSLDVDRERLRGWTRYRAVESGVRHLLAGSRDDGELLLEFAGWL
ncbi:aminoglycoside phosphotransferase family protein [Streptomyces sp. 549]|uniref:aminoglycoside phosphotransferase family protein n=1 Tax=Streptomyces sp. 549 TaxID=3049076 RepID=UPI0024C291B5|nr:aminoglycoside phosphotransferase family protein [Streptomyces sp. 549]MDK1475154.1 aminoglycoside phosphotransferase family protein [Streptomyces sp. 549]